MSIKYQTNETYETLSTTQIIITVKSQKTKIMTMQLKKKKRKNKNK